MSTEKSHPSFGLLRVSRVSGLTPLVGSQVEHQNFFTIEISEADQYEHHGEERFSSAGKKSIVRLYLSANQFVDMFSSIGIGEGIPCTLAMVGGERRERPEKPKSRIELSSEYGQHSIQESKKEIREDIKSIMEVCSSLPAKKREYIESLLSSLISKHDSNANFYLKRIAEETEKSVSCAKSEIDNYIATSLRSIGIEKAKDFALEKASAPKPELPE